MSQFANSNIFILYNITQNLVFAC